MSSNNNNNRRRRGGKDSQGMARRRGQNLISLAKASYQYLEQDKGVDVVQYTRFAEELAENIEQFNYPPLELPHSETKDFVSNLIRELVELSRQFLQWDNNPQSFNIDQVFKVKQLKRLLEFFK